MVINVFTVLNGNFIIRSCETAGSYVLIIKSIQVVFAGRIGRLSFSRAASPYNIVLQMKCKQKSQK